MRVLPILQMTICPTFPEKILTNTPYVSGKGIDKVVRFLEKSLRVIFKWFSDNQFQASSSKCHVLLSTDEHVQAKKGTTQIENSLSEKLLGVTIDAKLSFVKHRTNLS